MRWASVLEMVREQALQVISFEDLKRLRDFDKRGAPFSRCKAEEEAALERYCGRCEAVALKLTGQSMSKLLASTHHRAVPVKLNGYR